MTFSIRKITQRDDQHIFKIIKTVGLEYGAIGEGFGPSDSEVNAMSKYYNLSQRSAYFVLEVDGVIVGGSGIAAFCQKEVCELRKLFILSEFRGYGFGAKLLDVCLSFALENEYEKCYLDTLSNMKEAINLYKKYEFKMLQKPLEGTIHNGCDVWMIKTLN